MSNITISEIATEATTLNDNDLLLVSKNNGSSYISAKMKGSVLKSGTGTCQFNEEKVTNCCKNAISSTSGSGLFIGGSAGENYNSDSEFTKTLTVDSLVIITWHTDRLNFYVNNVLCCKMQTQYSEYYPVSFYIKSGSTIKITKESTSGVSSPYYVSIFPVS